MDITAKNQWPPNSHKLMPILP